MLSHIWLFAIQYTVACQAPLSMGFPRQEYRSGLLFPTLGYLPDQGSNPCLLHFLHWDVDSLPLCHPGRPMNYIYTSVIKYKGVKAAFLVESVFVADSLKVKAKLLSRVQLFGTPWTVACQAPPSMRFSRQECWSGLPFPSPGDLPNPGIKPRSPHCRQTLYHLSHQGLLVDW